MDVPAAYRHCEEITRSQARNFSYGIRLLPPAKRRALSAVYAFARRIDDIGDGDAARRPRSWPRWPRPGPRSMALAAEAESPAGPGRYAAGCRHDPVLVALADAGRRFPIPLAAFGELIDGCEADVRGTSYATFDDLHHYCRCVAGSIGRLSLGVFGTRDVATAAPLADALGVALQLTNILRDIREDYGTGRVYLPGRGLQAVRRRAAPERIRRPGRRPEAGRAGRVRGGPGPRLVRARAAADADAGPAQRGLHRRDGRHLLPAAAEHRGQPGRRAAAPGVAVRPAQKAMVAARSLARRCGRAAPPATRAGWLRPAPRLRPAERTGESSRRPAPAEGRGQTGRARRRDRRRAGRDHRRDRAARGGRPGHPARGPAPAGRRDLLVHPGRPGRRQRPARVPGLLHRLPGADRPARHDRLGVAPGPLRRHRAAARTARPGCAAPRCPARCTWARRWSATGCSRWPSGSG